MVFHKMSEGVAPGERWNERVARPETSLPRSRAERENDPVERQLAEDNRRIGELVMEVEILQ